MRDDLGYARAWLSAPHSCRVSRYPVGSARAVMMLRQLVSLKNSGRRCGRDRAPRTNKFFRLRRRSGRLHRKASSGRLLLQLNSRPLHGALTLRRPAPRDGLRWNYALRLGLLSWLLNGAMTA